LDTAGRIERIRLVDAQRHAGSLALYDGRVVPDRAFFATQRRFAERWAAVASVPIETAYLECTTWYRQAAGLERDFDPAHPEWLRLLAEVAASRDPDAVLHAWARAHERPMRSGPVLDSVWSPEDRTARVHFLAERRPEEQPLADALLPERRRELRDLVIRARAEHPEAEWLRGRSWLYGLEAYRRIFPPVFLAGLAVEAPDLQFLAVWGQLLDHRWRTRPGPSAHLLAAAEAASTTDDLEAAFPIPMWQTRAPLAQVAAAVGV
jgi:hypothetical protein